jgi:hypothetical protein
VRTKQKDLIERKLKEKKRKHEENLYKQKKCSEQGVELAGSVLKFDSCMQYFAEKVENCDELGDAEVDEINNFISQFGVNSPQITSVVYQLYNLNKEIEGESAAISELETMLKNQ